MGINPFAALAEWRPGYQRMQEMGHVTVTGARVIVGSMTNIERDDRDLQDLVFGHQSNGNN